MLRVHSEVRRKDAGVDDVEAARLVRLEALVHDACAGVGRHARGAEQVRRDEAVGARVEGRFVDYPIYYRAKKKLRLYRALRGEA